MSAKSMLAVALAASLAVAAVPAFAENPFSDVPLNHWAYDAVETLVSQGIIEGYPDNTFRGGKPMTRYEIASMIGRAMAKVNIGDEDTEQLKALVTEFAPELEALGVKIDGYDARLAALEKGLSGWKISGQMRFDYKNYDYDDASNDETKINTGNTRTGFRTNRARLFLHRDMANGISFDSRWHNDAIDRFFVTARNFMGMKGLKVQIGQFPIDWENEDGFTLFGTTNNDSWFMDSQYKGARVDYSNGRFTIAGFAASAKHNGTNGVYNENQSGDYYGARIKFNFTERFWASAYALWTSTEDDDFRYPAENWDVYAIGLGYKFANGTKLQGMYYYEDIEEFSDAIGSGINKNGITAGKAGGLDDNPDAYRIQLIVPQSVLGFTNAWLEYARLNEGFVLHEAPYSYDSDYDFARDYFGSRAMAGDTDVYHVVLKQQWTPKFSTVEQLDYFDMDKYNDVTAWTVSLGYQYSPALFFELSYTDQDGKCIAPERAAKGIDNGEGYTNRLLRFRTLFTF